MKMSMAINIALSLAGGFLMGHSLVSGAFSIGIAGAGISIAGCLIGISLSGNGR